MVMGIVDKANSNVDSMAKVVDVFAKKFVAKLGSKGGGEGCNLSSKCPKSFQPELDKQPLDHGSRICRHIFYHGPWS